MRAPLIPAVLAAAVLHPAQAANYTLAPVQDASIFNIAGGPQADGKGDDLWLGLTAGGFERRALLRFDLSVIPAGEAITSARLRLHVTRSIRSSNDATTLHRLQAAWNEGPSASGGGAGATAVAGDVTWQHRIHPDQAWAQPGGDFIATASATQSVGAVVSPTLVEYQGATLVSDLQLWHSQPATNFGWMLRAAPQGEAVTAKRFASRENGVPALRPQLLIETTQAPANDGDVPLPTWAIALLASALFARIWRR